MRHQRCVAKTGPVPDSDPARSELGHELLDGSPPVRRNRRALLKRVRTGTGLTVSRARCESRVPGARNRGAQSTIAGREHTIDGRRAVVRILLPALLAIVVVSVGATGAPEATIAAASSHTCVIEAGGTVTCWGGNNFGESSPPVGLTGVTELTAEGSGSPHVRASRADGRVGC